MPHLKSCMICDAIQALPNGKIIAIGISGEIILPVSTPTAFSFGVVADIRGVDQNKEFTFSIKLVSPDGSVINEQRGQQPKALVKKPDPYLIIGGDLRNVIFKTEGVYTLQFFIDDELVGTYEVQISAEVNQ